MRSIVNEGVVFLKHQSADFSELSKLLSQVILASVVRQLGDVDLGERLRVGVPVVKVVLPALVTLASPAVVGRAGSATLGTAHASVSVVGSSTSGGVRPGSGPVVVVGLVPPVSRVKGHVLLRLGVGSGPGPAASLVGGLVLVIYLGVLLVFEVFIKGTVVLFEVTVFVFVDNFRVLGLGLLLMVLGLSLVGLSSGLLLVVLE